MKASVEKVGSSILLLPVVSGLGEPIWTQLNTFLNVTGGYEIIGEGNGNPPIWTQLNTFLSVTGGYEIIVDLKKYVCWGAGVD